MKRERILTTFVQIVYVAAARTVSPALHGVGIAPAERPAAARATGSGPRGWLGGDDLQCIGLCDFRSEVRPRMWRNW